MRPPDRQKLGGRIYFTTYFPLSSCVGSFCSLSLFVCVAGGRSRISALVGRRPHLITWSMLRLTLTLNGCIIFSRLCVMLIRVVVSVNHNPYFTPPSPTPDSLAHQRVYTARCSLQVWPLDLPLLGGADFHTHGWAAACSRLIPQPRPFFLPAHNLFLLC